MVILIYNCFGIIIPYLMFIMKKISFVFLALFISIVVFVACGGGKTEEGTSAGTAQETGAAPNAALSASMTSGAQVYTTYCIACHQKEGQGMTGAFPPLAKSDYLMADATRAIRQVLYGYTGEMVVNGVTYNNAMPAQPLDDKQTADVLNYVMNTWGNTSTGLITPEMVAAERAKPNS